MICLTFVLKTFTWEEEWRNNLELVNNLTLRENCPNTGLFWPVFSRIWTKYGEIWSIFSVSLRIKSEWGKMWTRKTPYLDTFHAVSLIIELVILCLVNDKEVKKSSKMGGIKKILISVSLQCLATMAKVLILERRLADRLCLHRTLPLPWYFLGFKILSFKSFGKFWGNSYTKFIALETKTRFTCGKWNLY